MAIYLFGGKEDFLKQKELRKILEEISFPEMNLWEAYEYSEEIISFLNTFPVMDKKKICVLHFFPASEDLVWEMEHLSDDIDVYILTKEMPDQRKSLTKRVLKISEIRTFEKVSEEILQKSIRLRLARAGYTQEQISSVDKILQEVFYVYIQDPDMDLYQVQMHVDMIALGGQLDYEHIHEFAPDSENLKAYKLSGMLLERNPACIGFAQQLLLQGENPIMILSLILYQIRVCYKAKLFQKEKYLNLIGIRSHQIFNNFSSYSASLYMGVYEILLIGINRIKKGEKGNAVLIDCLAQSLELLSITGEMSAVANA